MAVVVEEATASMVGTVEGAALVRALRSVAPFTSADKWGIDILRCIRLDADGDTLTVVATDRYVLGSYRVAYTGPTFGASVPVADAKRVADAVAAHGKANPHLQHFYALTVDGDTLTVSWAGVHLITVSLDVVSHFPAWRALIPDVVDAGHGGIVAVNPVYLARFAKVEPAEGKKGGTPMTMRLRDALKPVRIDIGDVFTGLIMPVRIAR